MNSLSTQERGSIPPSTYTKLLAYISDIRESILKSTVERTTENILYYSVQCKEVLTNIYSSLSSVYSEIVRTNTKLSAMDRTINVGFETLSSSLRKTELPSNSVLINYPSSGIANITSTGYITVDFYNGKIKLPDGTTTILNDSVSAYSSEYIRSLTIYSDKNIDIAFTGKLSTVTSIPAGTYTLKNTFIKKLEIRITEETNIWISGCLSENGAPRISVDTPSETLLPNTIITGVKSDISTTASKLITASTPVSKVITLKVRSLGTGTYIALGNATSQPYRLTSTGDSQDIDWIDDLSKVYVITDTGSTGSIEWIGA